MELPEDRVPEDSRVEIDAKITAGALLCVAGSTTGDLTYLLRVFHNRNEDDRRRAEGGPR